MKTLLLWIATWMCVVGLGCLHSGCSLLGLAVDASGQPDTLTIDAVDKSLEGKIVLVTLRDGYSFAGECRRVGDLPAELYRPRYSQWHAFAGNHSLPLSPGDTVHIAGKHGQLTIGTLEGFTRTSAVVLTLPKAHAPFPRQPQMLSIPAENIDSLWKTDGTVVNGKGLRARLSRGSIPTTGAILLRKGESVAWIAMDDISRISEIHHSYQWLNVGAIVDAAGLAAALIFFAARSD